ncbi:MAG TPA: hypothetical protein VFX03_15635 [Thermomicrobiales bacterium]|nr:hypothetical protein [Thermomicrobiales bacterium]
MARHFDEIAKYPDIPSKIGGGPYDEIPPEFRPGSAGKHAGHGASLHLE